MVNSTSISSNSTSEPTYPVRGIGNDDPLYWTQIQISINSIYLFCIIGLLIAVWRLKRSNEKSQNRTFYLLIASMLLIGVTTVFTISSKLLFLVDAHLGINYQIFKGIFALFYFPGETVLIATIFSVLYNRFQNINLGSISNSMSAIRALFKFIVFISFILSTILIIANFIYTEDVISAASDSYPLWEYPVGWSKIATSYRCVIVVIGLHFLGFSASLLSSTKEQKSPNSDILILLGIVSPAVMIHGLFGTSMNGFLFDSLPFEIRSAKPYSWMILVRASIDPIFLTITFAGIVWILFIQKRLATSANLINARDLENGT